ncbi:MAG: SGNH/GDSL hydrolase family protein [Planctomycetota bacterium]
MKLLIAVLIAELTVRLVVPDFNLSPYWRYHQVLGWTQIPGLDTEIQVQGKTVRVQFNSLGFRDVEHEEAKPPGTRRIVVVGDSFSEAIQVNLEQTYIRRLQALLAASDTEGNSRSWEVINLGVGDFGTAQECIALENLGLRFDPDIVICQLFPLNDIGNNTIELAGLCKSKNDGYRPYFVEANAEANASADASGLELTTAQPVRNFLRRNVKVYGLVERVLLTVADKLTGGDGEERYKELLRDRGYAGLAPLLQTYAADHEQAPAVAKGWRITERLIERMATRCREQDIRFLLLVTPFEGRIPPVWDTFHKEQPPPAMVRDYPETRLARLCKRLQIPAVMMRPTFDKHADVVLPYIDGHPNPEGHRLTAEALLDAMAKAGWVR